MDILYRPNERLNPMNFVVRSALSRKSGGGIWMSKHFDMDFWKRYLLQLVVTNN
jgi:hypothetical protein